MHVEQFSSSLPYTMTQLRYNSKMKPQYIWQNEGTSLVICGKTKRGNGKRTTRETPALLPTPKSENAMFRGFFILFFSRTISNLITVQVLANATYPQPWDLDSICLFSLIPLTALPPHTQGFSQTDQKLCT